MIQNSFFSLEQMRHSLDVVSIENALIDLLVRANDADLKTFGMTKGVMQLVDEETQKKVLQNLFRQIGLKLIFVTNPSLKPPPFHSFQSRITDHRKEKT